MGTVLVLAVPLLKGKKVNKTQDLILGVLSGTQYTLAYPGVEAYIESIKRSGFSGRKVMLSWNLNPVAKFHLEENGFEVISLSPWPPDEFFHARMRLAWEYLKDHHEEFRYVFWLDIKDLVLQSDPSIWMEENIGEYKIVGSTECVTIEQEETNQMWAKTILGEDKYQEIKNEEVINGGTWAGESEIMTEVFHQVYQGTKDYIGPYPPCQIWINYVLRQKPFVDELYIPRWSEGFAACLHPCWSPWRTVCWPNMRDKHPVLDLSTCTLYPGTEFNVNNPMIGFNNFNDYTSPWLPSKSMEFVTPISPLGGIECVTEPTTKPFSIVHGYDRDWNMRELFEYKYKFNNSYTWEKFREIKAEQLSKERQPFRRALRGQPNRVLTAADFLRKP